MSIVDVKVIWKKQGYSSLHKEAARADCLIGKHFYSCFNARVRGGAFFH